MLVARCKGGETSFRRVRLRGSSTIDGNLQRKLNTGENRERNQCAVIAYTEGSEWTSQGCPNRHTGRKRVGFLGTRTRGLEYARIEQSREALSRWSNSGVKSEIESAIREPLSFAHKRDMGTLNVFLFRSSERCQVRVLELTKEGRAVAHTYPQPDESEIVIYLVASEGHLRRAKPSPATRHSVCGKNGNVRWMR